MDQKPVLITGGAGFIGCNLTAALARRGQRVRIIDNLSRDGVRRNLDWLKTTYNDLIDFHQHDVEREMGGLVEGVSAVLHLAAQVAVTTSYENPRADLMTNVLGTFNVLEAVRLYNPEAPVIFASTNKVYGGFTDVQFRKNEHEKRYEPPATSPFGWQGVRVSQPLDLYSPYGCSKGAADQYVHDYSRHFGLCTVVMRMSCVYGTRQFGTEDQGWLAHFLRRAIRGEPITIYGDGYQVRDVLYIDDCVDGWLAALDQIDQVRGRIFNLGGGPENAISLHNLLDMIERVRGRRPRVRYEGWRPGDQYWYVSDVRELSDAFGWKPKHSVHHGLPKLNRWLEELEAQAISIPCL